MVSFVLFLPNFLSRDYIALAYIGRTTGVQRGGVCAYIPRSRSENRLKNGKNCAILMKKAKIHEILLLRPPPLKVVECTPVDRACGGGEGAMDIREGRCRKAPWIFFLEKIQFFDYFCLMFRVAGGGGSPVHSLVYVTAILNHNMRLTIISNKM